MAQQLHLPAMQQLLILYLGNGQSQQYSGHRSGSFKRTERPPALLPPGLWPGGLPPAGVTDRRRAMGCPTSAEVVPKPAGGRRLWQSI